MTGCESTTATRCQLLGQQPADLAFRVLGGARSGCLIKLSSAKSTVGSSAVCDLRFEEPGVRPVHCLILRGAAATVVRKWSPDTLLNGRGFSDAPLSSGDRLTIGPLELEVVESGENRSTEPWPPKSSGISSRSDDPSFGGRVLEVAARKSCSEVPGAASGQAATSSAKAPLVDAEFARQRARLHAEQQAWAKRSAELESRERMQEADRAALAQANRLFLERQAALEKQEAALRTRQETLAARVAGEEARIAEQRAAAETERARLAARATEIEERANRLQANDAASHDAERALADREARLAVQQAALVADQAAVRVRAAEIEAQARQQHQALEAAETQWREAICEREARLAEQQAALEAERQALSARTEELEAEQQSLAARTAELEAKHVQEMNAPGEPPERELQLVEREAALEAERAALAAKAAELGDKFSQQQAAWEMERAETAARLAELEGYVEQLAAQSPQHGESLPHGSPDQTEQELVRLQAELEASQRLLATERAAWHAERDHMQSEWNELATEFERRLALWEAEHGSLPRRTDAARSSNQVALAESQENPQPKLIDEPSSPVPEPSPGSLAIDLLKQFGLESDARDQPSPRDAAVDAEPELAEEIADAGEQAAETGPAAQHEPHEEEDSIEAYMARLMERVGAKSQQTKPPIAPPEPELPRPRSQPVVLPIERETKLSVESQPQELAEPAPRLPPPERPTDISAMRELANMNARAAIEKHYRQTTLKSSLGKVVVAVTAAGAAAALYRIHGDAIVSSPGLVLVCLAITLVWGAEFLAAIFHLIRQRKDKERFAAGRPSAPATSVPPDGNA